MNMDNRFDINLDSILLSLTFPPTKGGRLKATFLSQKKLEGNLSSKKK